MSPSANHKNSRASYRLRPSVESLEPRVVLAATPYENFLQISEIMYNPAQPTPTEQGAGFTDNDQFEFMEFYNSSSSDTLNLTNVRITDGQSTELFNFSGSGVTSLGPDEYALVVSDIGAFRERYGNGLNSVIAGTYSVLLSNRGQSLQVLDPTGKIAQDFTYNDRAPWPVTPDGYGYSLNLINPGSNPDHDDPDSWTGDSPLNGTPGAANLTSLPPIVINEILARPDAGQVGQIELYNPTFASVDVGGWFLSDNGKTPRLYKIPNGSVVPANGYLVLAGDNDGDPLTDPGPGFFESRFALSAVGGDLYLTAGDGVSLFGYSESVQYDGSLPGDSLGRFPDVTGNYFFPMNSTLGAANSMPRLGNVLISEIMYHASTEQLEFVEIQNTSNAVVDLSGGKIDGFKFTFPAGTTIAPHAVLVVVPFDPVFDGTAIANFNAHYNVDIAADQERYIGPASGKLSNAGERITLLRRGDPPAGTTIEPLLFEDGVLYDDHSPWPRSADGSGDSLNRTAPDSFGDFASSWNAATPTPGTTTFAFVRLGDVNRDGEVNGLDVAPFVSLVTGAAYQEEADMNGDGEVNGLDVQPFVEAVLGSGVASTAAATEVVSSSAVAAPVAAGNRLPELPVSPAFQIVSQQRVRVRSTVAQQVQRPVRQLAARAGIPMVEQHRAAAAHFTRLGQVVRRHAGDERADHVRADIGHSDVLGPSQDGWHALVDQVLSGNTIW